MIDVRVYMLNHGVADAMQCNTHRTPTFTAVLGAVHIFEQHIHTLDTV